MGDIQKPTTRWKKRNVNKQIMKYTEQDPLKSIADDKTESFTNIIKPVNIGLDKEGNESPLNGGNESHLNGGNESPSRGNESPLNGGNESPLNGGNESPSRGNESPLNGGNESPLNGNKSPHSQFTYFHVENAQSNSIPFIYPPPLWNGALNSKSVYMTSPFNMTSAPLQTVFDNVLFNHYEKSTEGLENIANNKNKNFAKDAFKKAMEFMEKWIFKVLEFILIKGPTLMINKITDGICGNDNDVTPKEKDVVKSHVKEFFALLIAFYITFNWYYIMFYPRKLLPRPILKISTDNLTNKNKWVSIVFKYLIVPLSLLNSILLKKMPFLMRPFGKKLKFLFLFYFISKIIIKHGADIARGFLDSIRQKKTKSDGIFIAIMVVFGITSVLRVRFSTNYISELFRFYTTYALFFIPILIVFALRIVFSTMHAWIAGILFFSYLLLMSFFAMNIYGETANTLSVINLMDNYMLHKKQKRKPNPCAFNYYDDSGCAPQPFLVWLNEKILLICDYLFKYKCELIFFIFFMKSFYDYIYYLKGGNAKTILVVLTCFGIFLSVTSVGYRLFKENGNTEELKINEAKLKKEEEIKACGSECLQSKPVNASNDDNWENDKPDIPFYERLYKTVINEEYEDEDEADGEYDGPDFLGPVFDFVSSYLFGSSDESPIDQGDVNPEIAVTNTTLNAAKGLLNM